MESNRVMEFGGDNDFVLPDLDVVYLDREHEFVDAGWVQLNRIRKSLPCNARLPDL